MASADEYAAWIVQNQDKKGTPAFDTVAKAYQEAKSASVEATPPAPIEPQRRTIEDVIADQKTRGWGTGVEKAAAEIGGNVTDLAAKVLPPEIAAGAGYAANVVTQAVPALFGGGAVGKLAAPVMEGAAKWLMQTSVNPILKDLKNGRAAKAIETLLDEGITATKGGMERLRGEISDLNYEIANKIKSSTADVDKYAVWSSVKQQLDKFTRQAAQEADTAKIQTVWHEFLNHPMISGNTMPVQVAQELKQGTYKVLSKKYGEAGSAETEAQKAIARGLKEEVATAVPEVAALNAQESKLLNALNVTERRVLLEANKNPNGLALLAHSPATWAAFIADRSAAFKSLAAILLHKGQERIPQAAAGVGIATGRAENQ